MKSLNDPVSVLPGVGPKRQKDLDQLGIRTIKDLLDYFPFRYDDFRPKELSDITNQAKVTLKGKIAEEPVLVHFGYHRSRLNFKLIVDGISVRTTFFNQPWLKKRLKAGQMALIYGRFDAFRISMIGIKILSANRFPELGGIYPASKGIHQATIKRLISQAYRRYYPQIKTYLPPAVQKKYVLEPENMMVYDMHFPPNKKRADLARRTAKFNEFFLFQMQLQMMKQAEMSHQGVQINYQAGKIRQFIKSLPYQLTRAQRKVIGEIDYDLQRPVEMNRLLQGDVGSGKTIVAAIAIYATITAGYQAALMAPTEILAKQHANNLVKTFKGLGIRIALLTGDTRPAARRELLPRLAAGKIDLLIGTHALIQKGVKFKKLGLAVIDEQHRFGVKQRKALREKGRNPNMMAMTATPIPRTLAITSYGDMDVSIIDELPKGRKPVKTYWIRSRQVQDAIPFLTKLLNKGEQFYIVAPLIDESSSANLFSVKEIFTKFKQIFAPRFKVGLLYGSMKDEQKNRIMNAYAKGRIQILVSTTVIEVGVDNQNATLMMIYNADHFGLAQLHQLRGRVGRGSAQAYCFLVSDNNTKLSKERMRVMTHTDNGFIVSQKDLELRGPGDVLGKVQSGIPQFKVGDPIKDVVILNCAQQEAIRVISQKNWQKQPENRELVKRLKMDKTTNVLD